MDYEALEREGLVLVNRVGHLLDDPRSLTRDVARGLLVKLRRGAYVRATAWESASPRERHLIRARAVAANSVEPVTLAGMSAAALWGMPVATDWPDTVTLLDRWHGGGRAEPGVRRISAGFRTARTLEIGGFRATDLARTSIDVARRTTFANAVGSVDWALWRGNKHAISKQLLVDDVAGLDSRLGIRHLERVVNFATALSDSFGESECRAVIHLLGFEDAELQVEFRDMQGAMYPDFFWRSVRGFAEFDGKMKYTRGEYTDGDPAEIVWREKKREDRLRRLGLSGTRLLTFDVRHPEQLAHLLTDLGVPRGRTTAPVGGGTTPPTAHYLRPRH
jgi:hypothetical protein